MSLFKISPLKISPFKMSLPKYSLFKMSIPKYSSFKMSSNKSSSFKMSPKKVSSFEMSPTKELERNNLRNAFFNSNEIMEQRVESFKYSVKIESSYFAAGT